MREENDFFDDIDIMIDREYRKYQQERMGKVNRPNNLKNINNVGTAKKREPLM